MALVVVGFGQGGLFFWQLGYLDSSDKTAQRAAEAATKAAIAAAEAPFVERAWLSPEGVRHTQVSNAEIDGVIYSPAYGFSITWKNSGRTPAINANVFISYNIVPFDDPVPEFVGLIKEETFGVIGPGMVRYTNTKAITMNDFQALAAKRKDLYIYSSVTYQDVFQKDVTRLSELVYRVRIGATIRHPNGSLEIEVQGAPLGAQNVCT